MKLLRLCILIALSGMGTLGQSLCDQFAYHNDGFYLFNNNIWGQNLGSGTQCLYIDYVDPSSTSWHVDWDWEGSFNDVKSYPYSGCYLPEKRTLSAIKRIPTTAKWQYDGQDVRANVAYDLFTAADVNHDATHGDYELMIWLARLGSISPIGELAAYVTIDTLEWELYDGFNGDMHVYTFVAPQPVYSIGTDLKLFFDHLASYYGFPADTQYLLTLQAGTEPFTGGPATFTMDHFWGMVE